MNAVEIEEAISALAELPFDGGEFPFAFLQAFGNKETTIKRLRAGSTNASDLPGGVLQRSNIHIAVAAPGAVTQTLATLRASPATAKAKARFILATDGDGFEAEELESGETVACDYADFPNHFGFFLPLAGITTVKQIRESSFDIRATGRLNRLYVELLKDNPDWGTADRRPDMNHFMARLIFSFFAEDTDIFNGEGLFTATIEQMSARDSSNTHEVIGELFRAMNTPIAGRASAKLPRWADVFPYVNGGLFSGSPAVPRFSRIARSYLLHIGGLDWRKINPDIFGSMIQAVADDEERGALGMHYTSVPNILKVLNPLFLDELRARLEEAGDNSRMLLNLRRRMARIRVFDPACGSGNFLVIAYKEMRAIEAEINKRRGEADRASEIPLTNFRGIELRDFPAEIARLALIIAEYQADVLYRGQKLALAEFLPLNKENWITCGNALRLDWLSICPPTGTSVKIVSDDLLETSLDQVEIDFENEGGVTFICGNPPYVGTKYQERKHKEDIDYVFDRESVNSGNVDYIGCWFILAARSLSHYRKGLFAFVSTTSLFQGEQAEIALHILANYGLTIAWAHASFPWSNNAANNAGVICCIVGCAKAGDATSKYVYDNGSKRKVGNIGPYLVPMPDMVVTKQTKPFSGLSAMSYGSMSNDDGIFTVSDAEYRALIAQNPASERLIKVAVGGAEFIKGIVRRSIYVRDESDISPEQVSQLVDKFEGVRRYRAASSRAATRKLSGASMFFAERRHFEKPKIFVPQVLSERREYITVGLLAADALVIAPHMQIVDGQLFEFAILSSKMHHTWVSTVCGRLKSDIRYSNLLGWNTFPIPPLTDKNKADLTRSAQEILLAREIRFPATIAELYDPERMPDDLRRAHEQNDELVERIYVGRRFKNDTERLEKMLEMYSKYAPNQKGRAYG
jgi:hypothetical protein